MAKGKYSKAIALIVLAAVLCVSGVPMTANATEIEPDVNAQLAASVQGFGAVDAKPFETDGSTSGQTEKDHFSGEDTSKKTEEDVSCQSSACDVEGQTSGSDVAAQMPHIEENADGGVAVVSDSRDIAAPGERVVADGVYSVACSADPSLVLDVAGGSDEPGANVTLWTDRRDQRQLFRFEWRGGYYSVTALHSGQALDVVASGAASGTNVTQWDATGRDNQLWTVEEAGGGSYRIASKCNGLLLSSEGSPEDGSNVMVASAGAPGCLQSWSLSPADPLKDGVYYIAVGGSNSVVLGVEGGSQLPGGNIGLSVNNEQEWQRFLVSYRGDGYYSVTALHSGQALDVVASGAASGTNVTQWDATGGDNQLWAFRQCEDASFEIISKCNGLLLTSREAISGSNVYVDFQRQGSAQTWMFIDAPPVSDGVYFIQSALNSNFVCDVVAGSTEEGANVTLWQNSNVPWQKYRIDYRGDGYYSIIAAHSGQALDVVASGKDSPTNVTQWGYWGTDNQLWKIQRNANGSYSFVSKCNGLYLDVESGSASGGANICVSCRNGSPAQEFYLAETTAFLTTFKSYSFSLAQLLSWQRESPYATYTDEEGLFRLDPAKTSWVDETYFRFVDLRGYSGLAVDDLNEMIASTDTGREGTLLSQGYTFVAASQKYGLNEAFLLSLAILESGWGTSALASGTYYNGRGFWYSRWDEASGGFVDTWIDYPGYEPGTYYNYYGIGAIDSDPVAGGLRTAISNGWSSVAAAVDGGAEWISTNYVYASSYPQESLYEMRWDVDRSEDIKSRGWHQYSTNLDWDATVARQIATCYRTAGYDIPNLEAIVPQYR